MVKQALIEAHERGVEVRLVYNANHSAPIPVPPPPRTAPELIEALPIATKPIPGEPDLMHHKYVVRDGAAIWTGSMNWTDDSWSRQENVVAIVESEPLAHAFALNFEELWAGQVVEGSGLVEPRPVDVAGIQVRPWFAPGHGDELAHRIAKRLSQARRRIRIASPVLSSGPILGTLAEVGSDGKVDVAGVVDESQVDGVLYQWGLNGNASWKVPALRRFLETAHFSGKPSTGWGPTRCTTSCMRRSPSRTTTSSSAASISRTRVSETPRTCSRSTMRRQPTCSPSSWTRSGRSIRP